MDGQDGSNGLSSLIDTTNEIAGQNCADGGVRIDAGLDDNGNGVLDSSEIDTTQYVCNAAISQTLLLTSISTPISSLGCDAGGQVISHGLDNGDGAGLANNGNLETDEIDSTTTFCSFTYTGPLHDLNYMTSVSQKFAVGNLVYFIGSSSTMLNELWRTDGTVDGTFGLGVQFSSNSDTCFTDNNGLLFFHKSNDIWISDGTTHGTYALTNSQLMWNVTIIILAIMV